MEVDRKGMEGETETHIPLIRTVSKMFAYSIRSYTFNRSKTN